MSLPMENMRSTAALEGMGEVCPCRKFFFESFSLRKRLKRSLSFSFLRGSRTGPGTIRPSRYGLCRLPHCCCCSQSRARTSPATLTDGWKKATNQLSRLVEKSVHETESSSSSEEDDKDHNVKDELFQALYETPAGMKKTVTFSSVSTGRNFRQKLSTRTHFPHPL
ncbi:hypothetical protein Hamer_G025661 [Homarus americanus]|uniref:Uncharacterized protein n=1 Tax=Homarus americanus TaxID=6706 RepID=A0A8J5N8H4_HOMAM|nr:hypothetical protein Hamer_G025661 [Homarus americanus]